MYLVVKQRKGYRAIPLNSGDDWGMQVMPDGKIDLRIILRINQRHYQLYTTRTMIWKDMSEEDLCAVCKEIIAAICDSIMHRQDLVDLPLITDATEKRYRLRRKLDPIAQLLVDHIRVEHPDIIQIGHEPPPNVEQEELPY